MTSAEYGANEAERWFERYLRDHGYDYRYEPDLGVSRTPDFLAIRSGVEVVCEVKSFQQATALERRLVTGQPTMASANEIYGPVRSAVRQAARQLKPLAGSGRPLVVVLANPRGFLIDLDLNRLVEAMFGNPQIVGNLDAEHGQVDNLRFEYGRDGRLRSDHPYISAVAVLYERELAREHYEAWYAEWKQSLAEPAAASREELATQFVAAQEAWEASEASKSIPEGDVYRLDVMTTGSADAEPLPKDIFDGPRDQRIEVARA